MQTIDDPQCQACVMPMVRGFLADRGHYDRQSVTRWVEGEAAKSSLGVSIAFKARFELAACRCEQCGRVEFFALKPMTAN
ncbi:MAG: hypothetical protein AB8B50_21350 [Pirellulaceae bacterium]